MRPKASWIVLTRIMTKRNEEGMRNLERVLLWDSILPSACGTTFDGKSAASLFFPDVVIHSVID